MIFPVKPHEPVRLNVLFKGLVESLKIDDSQYFSVAVC